jgi:hypothetical protein
MHTLYVCIDMYICCIGMIIRTINGFHNNVASYREQKHAHVELI